MLPRFCLRVRIKYIFLGCFIFFILDFFGAFTHIFEVDFYKDFQYPVEGDVTIYAKQVRAGHKPDVKPINLYNYSFIHNCKSRCQTSETGPPITPRVVILVKSAMENFKRRNAIRGSWGYEKRFSDVIIRTVFLLGVPTDDRQHVQKMIDIEADHFKDVVQSNFLDTYYNNTIKTMMGFRWAVEFCPKSRFYMFVDDDFYVSTKNVLRFVRNPVNYPEYLEEADETLRKLARKLTQSDLKNSTESNIVLDEVKKILENPVNTINNKEHIKDLRKYVDSQKVKENKTLKRKKRQSLDMELPNDVRLFSGFVFSSSPHRHKTSKWHVSLDEYPYHMWPNYITAGAFILSREALFDMYYVSMFTKHFRFDDIFLGIVALKAKIEPLHSEEFYFHKAPFTGSQSFRYVIASHGYGDPDEMTRVWTESRAAGHA